MRASHRVCRPTAAGARAKRTIIRFTTHKLQAVRYTHVPIQSDAAHYRRRPQRLSFTPRATIAREPAYADTEPSWRHLSDEEVRFELPWQVAVSDRPHYVREALRCGHSAPLVWAVSARGSHNTVVPCPVHIWRGTIRSTWPPRGCVAAHLSQWSHSPYRCFTVSPLTSPQFSSSTPLQPTCCALNSFAER